MSAHPDRAGDRRSPAQIWTLRIVGCCLVIAMVIPAAIALRVYYSPRFEFSYTPTDFGLAYLDVSFDAKDGTPLQGWLIFPAQANGKPKSLIIISHGLGGSRTHMLGYAAIAAQAGHPSLLFDFRGHGHSGNDHTTIGFEEQQDMRAAINFATKKRGFKKVILWGLSMGAATSAMVGADHPAVQALILESSYTSLGDTINAHVELHFFLPRIPFGYLGGFWFGVLGGFDVDSLSPMDALKSMQQPKPVYVIGSKEDRRMPPPVTTMLFEAVNTPHKWLWLSETGVHANIILRNQPEYASRIMGFLSRVERLQNKQ